MHRRTKVRATNCCAPQKNRIIESATLHGDPDDGMRWIDMLDKKVI